MQTIETKYVGPTNFRGSRIIATVSGSNARVTIPYDCSNRSEEAHAAGAKALRDKMGWTGEMFGGHTKNGMVWIFVDPCYHIPGNK